MKTLNAILASTAIFAALSAAATPVLAQTNAAASRAVAFSIPARDMATALADFSRTTGLEVVADPGVVAGRRAPAVVGRFTPEEGLRRLLAPTGLEFVRRGDRVIVRLASSTPQASAETQIDRLDEIVVVAQRPLAESEAAALLIQRRSDNLVTVLAGDAIGRLPDQNIASAVSRAPGVAVSRDQGQARYVNLRGTPTNWNTISINGLNIVSPEGRATRYDNLPSVLAKQIVITKAITPDMPGESVAGNIDLITRTAFDYDGFTVIGNIGAGIHTQGGGEIIDGSLMVSDRFLDGRLGLLAQASYFRRDMFTNNWETDPRGAAGAAWAGRPANPAADASARFSNRYENNLYSLTRRNTSLSARADFRASDNHQLHADILWTEYADLELNNAFYFELTQGVASADSVFDRGTVYASGVRTFTNISDAKESTFYTTLGGDHFVGGWDASWRLNYTRTSDGVDAPAIGTFTSPTGNTSAARAARPTVEYDFTDQDNATVRLYRTVVNPTTGALSRGERLYSVDQLTVPLTTLRLRDGAAVTEAWTYKVDASRDIVLFGSDIELRAGALAVERTKESNTVLYDATPATITASGLNPATIPDLIRTDRPYRGDMELGYTYQTFSQSALRSLMRDLVERGAAPRREDLASFYEVTETVTAGYLMGKIDRDWGSLVAGARVERLANDSTGYVGARLIKVSGDETLVFPSAHLNLDVTDNWRVRVGLTTSASRPDFDSLVPGFSINDQARTISGGAPKARTEKQRGLDLYAEYYPDGEGFFTAGLFYKHITDTLSSESGPFGKELSDILDPAIDRSNYAYTRTNNTGDGHVLGFEAAYSNTAREFVERRAWPQWLAGFGVRASGVWIDTEVEIPAVSGRPARTAPLLGASDFTGNLQLTYEQYGLSVRLAYQYRTDWGNLRGTYTLINGQLAPNGRGDVFWDADDELDLSVRYATSDQIELFFDANNLLNGPGYRYGDSEAYGVEYETFGQTYMLGVRFKL